MKGYFEEKDSPKHTYKYVLNWVLDTLKIKFQWCQKVTFQVLDVSAPVKEIHYFLRFPPFLEDHPN